MASDKTEYSFSVAGALQRSDDGERVQLSANRSAGTAVVLRARSGQDVVELALANGPTLRLHPAHADLLLRSQAGALGRGDAQDRDGPLVVEPQLAFEGTGASRGLLNRVVLQALGVLKRPALGAAAALTAQAAAQWLEAATAPGVHRLPPPAEPGAPATPGQAGLPSFQGQPPLAAIPPSSEPMLVFVHGTFSSTAGTFGQLWERHPERVRALFAHYRGGVYGLDHHSVTQSPLQNALLLLQALPAGAQVHLVTHSRGGLVGEVLARAMRSDGAPAFDAFDTALLAGEGYAAQREMLKALKRLIAEKQPRFTRMLRVASPARGTLLASGRLDAYLGVIEWGLRAAGAVVLPELVAFATEVARERCNPDQFPGLEAMIPRRPITRLLGRGDITLASQLRVVAGDIQADSVLSWLKVLLTDALYLRSHDLVVNTDSMYGGQTRVQAPEFVFERGAEVSHFRYFANESSARAVTEGLLLAAPPQFRPIGALSLAGQASDGLRAQRRLPPDTGRRPALLVLPGIMGSHLAVGGKRIWASPVALLFGGLGKLAYPGAQVTPEAPHDDYYGELMQALADDYDVIPFAFDWRIPIDKSAELLAQRLALAMKQRAGRDLPVRVLAHSMGGIVARTVEKVSPGVWKAFWARKGARMVLSGTPNRGAFAPMLALSGQHPLVNGVEALDLCTSWSELMRLLEAFPGLMQLQALQGAGLDLTKRDHWLTLKQCDQDARAPATPWHGATPIPKKRAWGTPTQAALDQLRRLRGWLDERIDSYRALENGLVLVAGSAAQTIADLRLTPQGVEFLATPAGDGTVPWASLRLPGVACWRADAEHGDLLRHRRHFAAYRELLATGSTEALPRLADGALRDGAGAAAAAPALQPWVPVPRPYEPNLAEIEAAALGSGLQLPDAPADVPAGGGITLAVQLLHGDVRHVADALLVGHYRAETLTGAEDSLDRWLGGPMQRHLRLGRYPSQVGEVAVFVNQQARPAWGQDRPRPEAVVVAGLGNEGELSPRALSEAVMSATLAWSQHCAERDAAAPTTLALASLLIGTGGWRIDVTAAAEAIASGVCLANQRLADVGLPQVQRLTLIELFGDRASMAHTHLAACQGTLGITLAPQVASGAGARRRPVQRNYRGTDYDIVQVQSLLAPADGLSYAMHSGRARSEVREQSTQRRLVDQLVQGAEASPVHDAALAHALYKLLVPLGLRPALESATSLLLNLDADAARFPWEALCDGPAGGAAEPLAVRVRITRTLRLDNFRPDPVDNRGLSRVLVIGEPRCDKGFPPLPQARREAETVAALFAAPTWQTQSLIGPGARAVLSSLYAHDWRIVHVAGHGHYEPKPAQTPDGQPGPRTGGVVLEGGTYLGAPELGTLGTVPELVFINCCHLGRLNPGADGRPFPPGPRGEFAATLAEQLMRIGVRCVVVAGWAVADEAARIFASVFYRALLAGQPFADATLAARQATWQHDRQGNTWAAYQCYGDPGWRLCESGREAGAAPARNTGAPPTVAPTPTRADLFAALEEVAWKSRYSASDEAGRAPLIAQLQLLQQRAEAAWAHQGPVAEALGNTWAALGQLPQALHWLGRAVAAPDGLASLKARETLANLRARHAQTRDDPAAIHQALAELDGLIALQPSSERLSLRGSAYKRLALLAGRDKNTPDASLAAHLQAMTEAYQAAHAHARSAGDGGNFYAPMQAACGLLLQHLLARHDPQEPVLQQALLDAWAALQQSDARSRDFWSAVGLVEWEAYRCLALRRLDAPGNEVAERLANVHARDASVLNWSSVRDTFELIASVAQRDGDRPAQAEAAQRLFQQVAGYCAQG